MKKHWRSRSPWPSGHSSTAFYLPSFSLNQSPLVCKIICFVSPATWYRTSQGVTHSDPRHTWGPLLGGLVGFIHHPRRKDRSPLCWGISSPQSEALPAPRPSDFQPGGLVPHTNAHYQTTQPVSNLIVSFIQNCCPGIP